MERLIDADALKDTIEEIDWYHVSSQGVLVHGANSALHTPLYKADDIYNALDDAPTIDAVEVVRCKDCKYSDKIRKWNGVEYLGCCRNYCDIHEVYPNHFCSYGERRSDG